MLGIYGPPKAPERKGKPKKVGLGEDFWLELCSRGVPAKNTPDGVRAVVKDKPVDAASAQRYLDQGWSIRRASDEVGVSEGALRHAINRGLLAGKPDKPGAAAVEPRCGEEISGPAERAAEDQARQALVLASAKLPMATKVVARQNV